MYDVHFIFPVIYDNKKTLGDINYGYEKFGKVFFRLVSLFNPNPSY